jgi:hypothetical protein
MRLRLRLVAQIPLVVAALLAAAPGQAAMKSKAMKPIVLHPQFHQAGVTSLVETDGRYVFLARYTAQGPAWAVTDEQTGRRVTVAPGQTDCVNGGSATPMFGGPWLLISGCANPLAPVTADLYSLAGGTSQTVDFNVKYCSLSAAQCSFGPVGAEWLQTAETCYHCPTQYQFVNLHTEKLRGPPITDTKTILDLNSPTLTRRLCTPVTVPNVGTVTFFGSFAVVGDPYSPHPGYLKRCGSRLHLRLTTGSVLGNLHELLWYTLTGQLDGITLPGLKPFVVDLPRVFPLGMTGFELSSRTLYAYENNGQLWTAPAPLPRSK